ncbi:hypothetical protein [Hydrotalea sandarakina]|jgi:hypothetical protein|uniref:Uncharacterized protein n=1 Tax=Hydrotalea sandarakina TaxID=1004304 RepID=A0A2W7S9H9_9BACT|nr:hypothetical protein [Hydrotalea sandarakina]PZX59505.1 hypothetical protein LX80_02752 [Hydrotalea sandarakina]
MKPLTKDEMKQIKAGSNVELDNNSCPATCNTNCNAPYCKCDTNGSNVCDKNY